jgi:FkbM family methyltransferase
MTKLQLPNVTLTAIETRVHKLAALTIQDCLDKAEFGGVIIFSDTFNDFPKAAQHIQVEDWGTKLGYAECAWYGVQQHLKTPYTLFVEWDAGIYDPAMWKPEYLDYDYIGAPWPPSWAWVGNPFNVGNGGFALRSKRLIDYVYEHRDEYPIHTENVDVLFSRHYQPRLAAAGFKWAPDELALDFAFEFIRRSEDSHHFGYHTVKNWPSVLSPSALRERLEGAKTDEYVTKKLLADLNNFPTRYVRGYDANGQWQLYERNEWSSDMSESFTCIRKCRHGLFCYFPHDQYIGRALDIYGEYAEAEVDLYDKLLKPGMVVIEVGANMGSLTVPIAKFVGETGRVFAFEPQRIIFQQLCANLAMNGILNVFAEPMAVGDGTGEVGVLPTDYRKPANFGGTYLVASAPEMVPMIRLDDYYGGGVKPSFLKIDCEGMELAVLKGAEKMIAESRPAIYVEYPERAGSEMIQWLMDHKYDMWWHIPMLFNSDNFRANKDDRDPCVYNAENNTGLASGNIFCMPSEKQFKVVGLRSVLGPNDSPWETKEGILVKENVA